MGWTRRAGADQGSVGAAAMSTAPWVTPRHCYTWQVCPGSAVL